MSTILQPLRAGRFRHVVFAPGFGARRAINLARSTGPVQWAGELAKSTPAPLSRDERALISHVLEHAGLDLDTYRTETLRRRVPACLRALGQPDPREARNALMTEPSLLPAALSALIIGVTSFFRDAPVFDYLTFHALPNLARSSSRPLRIWSAGCSDGEELWSLAILLAELNLLRDAVLLGTDCRADALHRARAAVYDQQALKEVVKPWLAKYFRQLQNGRYQLDSALLPTAQWRRGNLLSDCEPGDWDLILCRNMAMYLQPEHAGRLWARLERSLRPDGYLVLGKAERPLGTTNLRAAAPCIYRRDRG